MSLLEDLNNFYINSHFQRLKPEIKSKIKIESQGSSI